MTEEKDNTKKPAEPAKQDAGSEQKTETMPELAKAENLLKEMKEREKALLDREKALNDKLKALDEAAAKAKLAGYGEARKEPSEDEKADAAAMTLIAGTGFERYLPPKK